jgi:Co/Zn/Cd efflux system component
MDATEHHCGSPRFETGNPLAERGVRRALWLTSIMMVVEIVGGWWFNSMAVLADGWHMSSHSVALGLSVFAYVYARTHATGVMPLGPGRSKCWVDTPARCCCSGWPHSWSSSLWSG